LEHFHLLSRKNLTFKHSAAQGVVGDISNVYAGHRLRSFQQPFEQARGMVGEAQRKSNMKSFFIFQA